MSGRDNLRPLSQAAVEGFLDRRAKYSDAAEIVAVLARFGYVGAADDSAGYRGALATPGRDPVEPLVDGLVRR